jgi:hypothetical protein
MSAADTHAAIDRLAAKRTELGAEDFGAYACARNVLDLLDALTAAEARAARLAEVVARVEALADELADWTWTAPVGPGNASYANGYENGCRSVADTLSAALASPASVPETSVAGPESAEGTDCGSCWVCIGDKPAGVSGLTIGATRMIVCSECGNKRCPHGTDHRNECTGSNEPGQEGSRYGHSLPFAGPGEGLS